ncbi:MAG: ABC transporter ATP-binding protein, partial [Phycisphaeraceae bacterium]|nr:ABC transporter ATP-binding protein [Phycisphaeraceae bacterium]
MTDRSIKVENLSKKYIIGKHAQKGDGLRHIVQNALGKPTRWAANGFRRDPRTYEEFWALKDINFDVGIGEVVGIIGRNGAGKSTLLKVLSRITEQTTGRITLRGRMASLLEVGTGFHPELTGRENIYLNGAVLGMARTEIKRKFDEIVAFAEVAKFLDTPVKRYSSGMYVRLAFAVAAHLEPEILVVDEVLAVGDMDFQRKCLGKMDEVSKQGRTVLFVSHNMATIARLCERSIMLKQGQLVLDGATGDVINEYLAEGARDSVTPLYERTDRMGEGQARMMHVELL